MASSSDSHGWVHEADDRYELPLQRYARWLLGDFDLAADRAEFLDLVRRAEGPGVAW